MIFAQQQELMTTRELATLLLMMAGGVVFFVTVVFLVFKRFGKQATAREKAKAIRMEERGERPPNDR